MLYHRRLLFAVSSHIGSTPAKCQVWNKWILTWQWRKNGNKIRDTLVSLSFGAHVRGLTKYWALKFVLSQLRKWNRYWNKQQKYWIKSSLWTYINTHTHHVWDLYYCLVTVKCTCCSFIYETNTAIYCWKKKKTDNTLSHYQKYLNLKFGIYIIIMQILVKRLLKVLLTCCPLTTYLCLTLWSHKVWRYCCIKCLVLEQK